MADIPEECCTELSIPDTPSATTRHIMDVKHSQLDFTNQLLHNNSNNNGHTQLCAIFSRLLASAASRSLM